MIAKDAMDIALKYADLFTKLAQFFVAISVAIGGWLISSDAIHKTEAFSTSKVAWVVLYTGASLVFWIGLTQCAQRANASYRIAKSFAESEGYPSEDFSIVAKEIHLGFIKYTIPVAVLFIDLLILASGSVFFN